MADDPAPSNTRRNNGVPVLCEAEASSSFSSNPQNEQSSDEPGFNTSDLLFLDYFAAPSKVQQEMGDCVVASTASLQAGKVESPSLTNPELDWIEPSTPIRSCVIGTSEDEDSCSRSCSSDSREGSGGDHLFREKDGDPYIGDYNIVLHDVPMDAREESHAEVSGVVDDEGGGNEAPWRCCLGAWLSEAGRSSTFCSIALAAAVLGLVLVGSGWHRVQLQLQKFRCQCFSNRKGISQVMYQLVNVKGSSAKPRRVPVLKAQSCFSGVRNAEPETFY